MSRLHFDCTAGVAGDMVVGALLDLGLDFDFLSAELAKLGVGGYQLGHETVRRRGFRATHFQVTVTEPQPHRTYSLIAEMIDKADLAPKAKQRAQRVFLALGKAEANVHGVDLEQVHFHEVGAVDSIVDIVGASIGLTALGIEHITASPINVGSGTVKTAHGVIPVPAPATVVLAEGLPIYADGPAVELATPTGMALLSQLADSFGPMPPMTLGAMGFGAGTKDLPIANVLRATRGEAEPVRLKPVTDGQRPVADGPALSALETDRIHVIEANIDDMSAELLAPLFDRLLAARALDVTATPVMMKKGRLGQCISVMAEAPNVADLIGLILAEASTIGVRVYECQRFKLARESHTLETPYGMVRVKLGLASGRIVNMAPEFEDCKKIAVAKGRPVKEVYQAAVAEAHRLGLQVGENVSDGETPLHERRA